MSIQRYAIKRTIQTIILLWLVLSGLFIFFRLLPGDFTNIMVFRGASEETVEMFQNQWNLNDPLYLQYWAYMKNFIGGNFGVSFQTREPVLEFVSVKLFNSFILVAPAITVGYVLGSIFGAIFGRARGTTLENWGLLPVIFFGSFPSFFIALVLVILFAGVLNWVPTSGMVTYGTIFGENAPWWKVYTTNDFAIHYALPFTAIVLRYLYSPTLIMRTSVVETIGQDFTFYHRITGISEYAQLKHIMRHSILPVITLYPVSMTRAIGGLVLVEKVFNWPGIGSALVAAVLARDFPVIQFIFFLVAAFVILSNFAVDILYGVIDPRVSVED
jgi:peptide/nickel transport system permease protein